MPSPAPSSPAAPSAPLAAATPTFRRWTIAVTVYIAAVFNRTSLGVAGLEAASRFRITPGQLSVFVLAQLGVYAAMQVPTGLLVDRYGPRRLLITAACTMAVAQLAFAFVQSYPGALLARAILGCGDAMTFVSVVRFAAQDSRRGGSRWPCRSPRCSAWRATSPRRSRSHCCCTRRAGLPRSPGRAWSRWPRGWRCGRCCPQSRAARGRGRRAAGSGGLVAVRQREPGRQRGRAWTRRAGAWLPAARRVSGRVHAAWRTPGTRLGFWVHFSCMSLTTMFSVLWGVPYLVAQGFSPAAASAVLLVCVLAAIAISPAVGMVFGRFPAARVPFAVGVCLVTVAGWVTLLACFDGRPPHALVIAVAALRRQAARVHHRFLPGPGLQRAHRGRDATGVVNRRVQRGHPGLTPGRRDTDLAGRSDVAAYRLAFGCAVGVLLLGTSWRSAGGCASGACCSGPSRAASRPGAGGSSPLRRGPVCARAARSRAPAGRQ